MLRVLKCLGGAMASFALCTVAPAVAQDSAVTGTVSLMAYTAVFQDNYTRAVIDLFRKKYPGINVVYHPVHTSAQMLGVLRTQKDSPQIDVAILDITVAKIGTDEGLFAKLDPAKVPNINDLYPQATVAGVNGRAVTLDHVALIYNTQQIKSAPTSWSAIWDPSLKGKIVVPGIPDTMGILVTVIATKLAGGDPTGDLAKGWQKMVELAPLVQTWDPKPDAFPFIINGSGAIGTGWNARAQYWHTDSKGVLGVTLPKEGSVMQINMINLVAGSKNQAAAELFINFALSAEAQKSFTEAMFYGPTNKKAEISPEALARTGASATATMIPLDWIELARTREQFTQQWRRVVLPASR